MLHFQKVTATDGSDAPLVPPRWLESFVQMSWSAGSNPHVPVQASAAGDLLVLQLSCDNSTPNTATGATFPAPAGWTWTQATPVHIAGVEAGQAFYAIAPDTQPTSLDVTWHGTGCNNGTTALGDEFANVVFESAVAVASVGDPQKTVVTGHDNDVVWAAAAMQDSVSLIPPLEPGADNMAGDMAGYLITSDPAGSSESVMMRSSNTSDAFALDVLLLAPD